MPNTPEQVAAILASKPDNDAGCPKSPDGWHRWKTVSENWESERRRCEACGESHTLWDEDMK